MKIHIASDPRRFERPLAMDRAVEWARAPWDAQEAFHIVPGPGVVLRTLELLQALRLSRKRILDTALAASLESAGVRRQATLNAPDFQLFPFLEVVAPS